MNENHPALNLGDVSPCEYLLEALFEIGPGAGGNPLDWAQIHAWQGCTGVSLSEFEAVSLVHMSREYMTWAIKGQEPDCPAPRNLPPPDKAELDARENRIRASLRAAAAARSKK